MPASTGYQRAWNIVFLTDLPRPLRKLRKFLLGKDSKSYQESNPDIPRMVLRVYRFDYTTFLTQCWQHWNIEVVIKSIKLFQVIGR